MNKVLIVEDEAGIRNGIANAYQWGKLNCELCGLASTGIEALEICLTLQPDIVISDIVIPGIDGLTLLNYIRQKYPSIHFIILTGHRNFDYAKNALNLGAEYFLLKPIEFTELEEAIQNISQKISLKNEEKSISFEKEHLLLEILNGGIIHKSDVSQKGQKFLNDFSCFRVCTLRFDDDSHDDYFRNQQLLTFCTNLISTTNILTCNVDNQGIILVFLLADKQDDIADTKQYLQQLQEKIYQFFHISASIGISAVVSGYQNAKKGYLQSLQALSQKFYSGRNSINIYALDQSMESYAINNYHGIAQYCKKTITLVNHYRGDELNEAGAVLFDEFIGSLQNQPAFVKASFIVLCTLCIKKVIGEDHCFLAVLLETHANFQKVLTSDSLDIIKEIYLRLLTELSDYLSVKYSSKQEIMKKVISYIEDNYQKNLTLSDLSKKVYLSPAYLSSLITNELGKSFIDILNEVRISNSIKLLRDPKKKISEIALEVGYNEPQYFTTVFKKYTDLTPKRYRDMYLSGQRTAETPNPKSF